jgi:hypothetical protein
MVAGIFSAFLYDSRWVSHWFAIGLGIFAGVLATGTYFYNQFALRRPDPRKSSVELG